MWISAPDYGGVRTPRRVHSACPYPDRTGVLLPLSGPSRLSWLQRAPGGLCILHVLAGQRAGWAGVLAAVVRPERDVGGFQGAVHDAGQVGLHRGEVDGVLEPGGE